MKQHYDICLTGVWYGFNYGSLLNGYSAYRIFKDMGKSVLMLMKPGAPENDGELREEHHNMRFLRKYYHPDEISPALPFDRLHELNQYCDCFCSGSDQIWNYSISFQGNQYLPFVSDEKRKISFATSFGHRRNVIPENMKNSVGTWLSRYDAISVREGFDAELLREEFSLNGKVVLDPVFCVDSKIYYDIADTSNFDVSVPYMLTYILDPTPEKRRAIQYYGEKLGVRVVNILDGMLGNWKRNKEELNLPNILENVGVEDFLKAYINASYVITDSFHGTAFSIVFNKPFIAIGNYKRGIARFLDLLGRMKLEDRLIKDMQNIPLDEKYLSPIDYTYVRRYIQEESKKTTEWLRNAVEQPKELLPSVKLPSKMITRKMDMKHCVGCGACMSTCPVDAIQLLPDQYGYYCPVVNYEKCINCGKCVSVCPAFELPQRSNEKDPVCMEFQHADEAVIERSSSGGIFTALANVVLQNGGYVAGAAWADDFSVKHIIIDNVTDLDKLRKSKYLQSYLGNIFRDIKELLLNNKKVLFTGCPCQIAGLKKYLNKDYVNLILVDLLCGNSPSTEFFTKYIKENFGETIYSYEFRAKDFGWDPTIVKIKTKTGDTILRKGPREDDYQRVYHNHTMCSWHCENCIYQAVPRFGDLTIGDFWGIGRKNRPYDFKKGVSVVLCNNSKGMDFLQSISRHEIGVLNKVPLEWIEGNGYAINGAHNFSSGIKRDMFHNNVAKMSFHDAVNYALKPNHGVYQGGSGITPLEFSSRGTHFSSDDNYWEEHYINGFTTLITKMSKPPLGKFACLDMENCLEKGRTYILKARFRIKTTESILNFHVKDSGSRIFQLIHSFHVKKNYTGWNELNIEFIPNADFYDQFMFGAAQVAGEGRFLMIDYIYVIPKFS